MCKRYLSALFLCLTFASQVAIADQNKKPKPSANVLTTLPMAHAIALALLEGTNVDVNYLPPKRLPVSRVGHWLKQKSDQRLAQLPLPDVVITTQKALPELSAYTQARVRNIRVVQVDLANELVPKGAHLRFPIGYWDDTSSREYFWLDPDNLSVMVQIAAREFAKLWPQEAQQIVRNAKQTEHSIRAFALDIDQLLLEGDIASLCLHNPELAPLTRASFLPVSASQNCEAGALHILKKTNRSNDETIGWYVNAGEKPLKLGFIEWLEANRQALKNALELRG